MDKQELFKDHLYNILTDEFDFSDSDAYALATKDVDIDPNIQRDDIWNYAYSWAEELAWRYA